MDQAILVEMLARVIRCRPTLDLAETIIAGSNPQEEVPWYFPGDDLFTPFERRRGLPLGNQTSQFFANVYLNGMDQFIDRQVKPPVYVRYVDDWVVFDDDKERLGELRVRLEAELARVRLRMHPGKSRVYRCRDGLTFLGWRLFPGHARLARGNVVATQRRMRRLQERASSTGNE
ncbi:MAG: RNA-directed DNA polymerase [Bryobacteraceae bacterium]